MPPRPAHSLAALFWTLLLLGGPHPSQAAEWQVKPGKSAQDTPLTQAIATAQAGDTLILAPGVYHERVQITRPLTLRGQPGAILDGSQVFQGEWSAGDSENVWVIPVQGRVYGLLIQGRFVAELRHSRAQKEGDWHWQTLLKKGPPLSGFDQIRALWVYHPKEQKIYAHFEKDASPKGLALSVVTTQEPLIQVSNASDVRIEGLEFRGASVAISLAQGARSCTVSRCKITSYEKSGIVLTDGASQCVIEDCDITRGALEEWTPNREQGRVNYEIWRIHKDVGNYDRVGIALSGTGRGNRILRNHLHRTFDGITLGDSSTESLDIPLADPDHGRDTEIADNLIEDTRDSGIELGIGCIQVDVHHNTLRRTHGGLRFKLPRIGPVFVHHNRLLGGAPFNVWFSMDSSPAEGYIYHNTFLGGDPAVMLLSFNGKKRDFAAPKWHILNNLVLGKDGFFSQGRNTPAADFLTANNICVHDNRPWPNDAGRDKGSLYNVAIAHDENGKPAPGSAARDAGLDLTTYWNGKPLPGCEPGSFKGKAPDAGADEIE
ncbi:MAG: right-handed parallel beta-helix repeat-containing protein [Verrucomicrobiota bacterium]